MRASPPLSPAPWFTTKDGKKNCGKSHTSHHGCGPIGQCAGPAGQELCQEFAGRVLAKRHGGGWRTRTTRVLSFKSRCQDHVVWARFGPQCLGRYAVALLPAGRRIETGADIAPGGLVIRVAAKDQVAGAGGRCGGSGGAVWDPGARPAPPVSSSPGDSSSGLTQASGSFQGTGMFWGRSMSRV